MNKSISLHKNLISKYLDNFFKYDYDLLKKESTESELFVNIEEGCLLFLYYCFEYLSIFAVDILKNFETYFADCVVDA